MESQSGDTDNQLLTNPGSRAVFDLFPAGNETYSIKDERLIILDPVTNNDDGTLMVIGS